MTDDNWVTVLKADDGSELRHNSASGHFGATGEDWALLVAAAKEILRLKSERRLAVDVLREIRDECIAGARLSAAQMAEALIEDLSR